jgi:hypothetical protein
LAGQLEFLASELGRLFRAIEPAQGQRGLGAPRKTRRVAYPERVHRRAERPVLIQGRLGRSRLQLHPPAHVDDSELGPGMRLLAARDGV